MATPKSPAITHYVIDDWLVWEVEEAPAVAKREDSWSRGTPVNQSACNIRGVGGQADVRTIQAGSWITVDLSENRSKGTEQYAKVLAIRECGSGRSAVTHACISMGMSLGAVELSDSRDVIFTAREGFELSDSSVVLTDELHIIHSAQILKSIDGDLDAHGTMSTGSEIGRSSGRIKLCDQLWIHKNKDTGAMTLRLGSIALQPGVDEAASVSNGEPASRPDRPSDEGRRETRSNRKPSSKVVHNNSLLAASELATAERHARPTKRKTTTGVVKPATNGLEGGRSAGVQPMNPDGQESDHKLTSRGVVHRGREKATAMRRSSRKSQETKQTAESHTEDGREPSPFSYIIDDLDRKIRAAKEHAAKAIGPGE
ncbi:hypothetical protein KVT40_006892 [Elsinoe batatas]|uniref:Uncharacterized protein n=1 Tax=Elsinoe batatas TaxID=2601811 RepID=A0A8K0PD04_9PEZI|nr:hypothetical protein KVT40_006892 [Elsinoe batatas]